VDDPIMEFLRSQAHNYSCRVCGANHRASALRKVAQDEHRLVVQVTCPKCQDKFFLRIQFTGTASVREPVASPLDERPRSAPPVTADEVLDVHSRLDAFRGPLLDLLKKR
jgi:hypothetical protein